MNHLSVRVAVSVILMLGLLAFVWPSQIEQPLFAQQPPIGPEPQARSVTVSGSGQINVQPDVGVVVVGVQTEAAEAGNVLAQNNEQMQAVIDALTEAGVAEDDIQTQTVQLQPIRPMPPPDQPFPAPGVTQAMTPTSFVATNLVQVRVRAVEDLGTVLDAAVEAGANRVESIRFEVSNPLEALVQARDAAWEDARQKAEQLVGLADAELGEVLTINEATTFPFPTFETYAAFDVAAVPVQPGAQTVTVNIQVTWRLAP
jgi:uncharacterized protein YggE